MVITLRRKQTKKKTRRDMAYCHILVSAFRAVCRGYAYRPSHAKDSHKIGKNASLLGMHALGDSAARQCKRPHSVWNCL